MHWYVVFGELFCETLVYSYILCVYWVAMENVFIMVDHCQKSLKVTVLGAALHLTESREKLYL